jgi:hypothetical protein
VTKAEKAHLTRLAEYGCVICRRPAEIHHPLKGKGMGMKAGHFEAIPLCHTHHRTGGHGVAIHAGIKTWEANHGTEAELLERVTNAIRGG